MPMLPKLINRVRAASAPPAALTNPRPLEGGFFGVMGGRTTKTGRTVDDETALQVSAIYRAVAIIASTVGALPLHVYRSGVGGQSEKIEIATERYIWDRPNPEVSRSVFWETVIGHCVLTGNAYIYVARDKEGRARELWPVEPRRVKPGRVTKGTLAGRKAYLLDGDRPERDFSDGGNLVHVPGLGFDGLQGYSPIKLHAEAIGLALAAEDYAGRFFGQGAAPGGYLTSDQALTPEQAQEISEAWAEYHEGLDNAHRPAVFGRGMTWASVALNPEDAQLLEVRKFQVTEIARLFGVPPHLLGDVERSTSWGTGIEEQARGFVTFTLQPWLVRFEQAITNELLRPAGHYARFEVKGLLRGNSKERAGFYTSMRHIGAMNANEIRALEEMPAIEGDKGSEYWTPLSVGGASTPEAGDVPSTGS